MDKKCKHCAMMIPKEAKVCPHCRKKQGTSLAVGCLAILFILFIIGMTVNAFREQAPSLKKSASNSISASQGNKSQTAEKPQLQNKPVAAPSPWEYGETTDKMSGKVSKHAINRSINTVNFNFPYQGTQHGTIMVFGKTVLFYVKKGQISCHGGSEYGACLVRVKFDEDKESYVRARKSGDDSTTISITEPGFLEKLKQSRKLMIEVEVYRNGLPVFTFDVKGLIQK